jgi:hypothetical protein
MSFHQGKLDILSSCDVDAIVARYSELDEIIKTGSSIITLDDDMMFIAIKLLENYPELSVEKVDDICKGLGLSEAISKRWIHGLVRAYSRGPRTNWCTTNRDEKWPV